MTASWFVVLKRLKPPVAASSFPTARKTSRRKAKSSPSAGARATTRARPFLSTVKAGDRVLFGKYAGTEIKIDGEDFLIMREEEVLGILEGAGKPALATK